MLDNLEPEGDNDINIDSLKEMEELMKDLPLSPEVKINPFSKDDIDNYLNSLDLSCINSDKPYLGFDNDKQIKRILVISHSGFISELINLVRKSKGLKINMKNITNNTGIHVIRIYCSNCGIESKCLNTELCKKIEFDFILNNDISHLEILK